MCGKSFSKLYILNRHLKKHKANQLKKIAHCKKLFIDLKLHMLRHSDENPHKCKQWEKSFARLSNFNRHTFKAQAKQRKLWKRTYLLNIFQVILYKKIFQNTICNTHLK